MKINVNGKQIDVDNDYSLTQLAEFYKLDLSKTVVELNGEIIDKNSVNKIKLNENDKIEFIQFVGGG